MARSALSTVTRLPKSSFFAFCELSPRVYPKILKGMSEEQKLQELREYDERQAELDRQLKIND